MQITPIPHSEAAALIKGKPAVTRAVFDALAPDLQARAFTITGVECLHALARVRELTAQLPVGGDFEQLRSQIFSELSPWLIDPDETDEKLRSKQVNAARNRAELLLRMHGWQAYAQTQHALMEEHTDVFPFRQYLSSEDGRVRPSHAALNKKILPSDHPFWEKHTPPWEFNCRCDCVPMTQADVSAIAGSEQQKPLEDRRVMPPAQLREISNNQRIVKPGGQGFLDIRTPRERSGDGKGYEFNPGRNNLPITDILASFTPAERTTFYTWAEGVTLSNGATLREWWGLSATAKKARRAAAVTPPALPPVISADAVSQKLKPVKALRTITEDALAAIDAVHKDGPLPVIDVKVLRSKKYLGVFRRFWDRSAQPLKIGMSIGVRPDGMWPRLTTLHEIGHFIDYAGIDQEGYATMRPGRMDPFLKAVKKSTAYKNIALHTRGERRAYLQDRKELLARAYAQYIAHQSSSAVIRAELKKAQDITPYLQWADDDFLPIKAELDQIFKDIGWLL